MNIAAWYTLCRDEDGLMDVKYFCYSGALNTILFWVGLHWWRPSFDVNKFIVCVCVRVYGRFTKHIYMWYSLKLLLSSNRIYIYNAE